MKRAAVRYECRATRHWMNHVPPRGDWERPAGRLWAMAWAVMHFECQRPGCEVWRHDAIDHNGGLLARRYDYPDWYGLDTDEERPDADQLRLFLVHQLEKDIDERRARRKARKAPAEQGRRAS